MTLSFVLWVKAVIFATVWMCGWMIYYAINNAPVNRKTMSIVMTPWGLILLYIFVFWWG